MYSLSIFRYVKVNDFYNTIRLIFCQYTTELFINEEAWEELKKLLSKIVDNNDEDFRYKLVTVNETEVVVESSKYKEKRYTGIHMYESSGQHLNGMNLYQFEWKNLLEMVPLIDNRIAQIGTEV